MASKAKSKKRTKRTKRLANKSIGTWVMGPPSLALYVKRADKMKLGVLIQADTRNDEDWAVVALETSGNGLNAVLDSHAHVVVAQGIPSNELGHAQQLAERYAKKWLGKIGKEMPSCECEEIQPGVELDTSFLPTDRKLIQRALEYFAEPPDIGVIEPDETRAGELAKMFDDGRLEVIEVAVYSEMIRESPDAPNPDVQTRNAPDHVH